jgi:ABC-type branched-subunit amino acid transport system ATPase component
LLELDGVMRTFGGLKAVDGLSLSVAEGEIHGIIGPNGAGKTTLFNVINGFLPANAGSIRFAGAELLGLKPHRVCRRGIGRTFQVVRAFARNAENVVIGAYVAPRRTVTLSGWPSTRSIAWVSPVSGPMPLPAA